MVCVFLLAGVPLLLTCPSQIMCVSTMQDRAGHTHPSMVSAWQRGGPDSRNALHGEMDVQVCHLQSHVGRTAAAQDPMLLDS